VSTHCEMADPSSFSNFRNVVIRSSKLEWKVDMEAKTISGKVEHEVEGVCEKNNEVVLDARDLTVERVLWKGVETQFKYQKVNEALGDKLSVTIPSLSKGDRGNLSIFYRTSTSARALQFLSPAQTTDHKGPYLFSQCQAIHARSILPCFDTPAVKSTYSSRVCVPAGLTCLMSAISTGKDTSGQEEWVFSFNQSIPIPSYLIAIVVGVLEEREIGPRSAVWAEPSVVDTAAKEFMETEQFIKAAEEICGEYVWKRYDLVVLPNTFPYGGMENPCLTFVTPTIITGDRSLVSVVAHEIAHSWTGNLVTTANWDHFWLNEGFTVYLERKIIEKVYGKARRFFDSKEGFDSLNDTLKFITPDHSKLRLNLGGIDPDDAFSSIPYEKGSSLLLYLEQEVLSESETLSFLKEHVSLFSQSSLDTETWLDSMYQRYPKMKEKEEIVNQWLYGEGMPPKQPKFLDDSLLVECGKMMDNILSPSPSSHQFSLLTPSQKVFVLNALGDKSPLDHSKVSLSSPPFPPLAPLSSQLVLLSSDSFGISSSHNCEILCPFIQIGLSSEWEPSIQIALHFAKTYGRLKYCKKTYGLLFAWEKSRQLAIDQFEKEKSNMHPITVQQVESLLNKYK
ncbi:hypothetical protein PENTCL1PPCAC_17762, partial [Pristionchus entomophagus]